MGKILTILSVIILLVSGFIYGEEPMDNMTSLNTIIDKTGAELRWDPYRSYGELTLFGQSVIFKPDIPFLLINYSEKSENVDVKRGDNGAVLFSHNLKPVSIFLTALIVAFDLSFKPLPDVGL